MSFFFIVCLRLLTLSDVFVAPEKNKMEGNHNLIVKDIHGARGMNI